MSMITVTPATLSTKATELKNKNKKLNTMISELKGIESSLNSMWDGEARQEFHTQFNKDMGQMEKFKQLIDKYAQALEDIKKQYETTEKAVKGIATTRTYRRQ